MRNLYRLSTVLFFSLTMGAFLGGCPPQGNPVISDSVTITYDQVGACNGYKQTTGPGGSGPQQTVSAGPNQAFLVFRIVSIDNSKSSKDFNFDPSRVFVIGSSPKASMNTNLSLARDIGVFAATATTIPKSQVVGLNGITVTVISTGAANGASEANNRSYTLGSDTVAGDPGIFFVKRNSSQNSWPNTEDCATIKF